MHVFLAGSTGVLGRRIIPLLTGHGHQVTALTRRSDRAGMLRSLGAHPAVADAFEAESTPARSSPDARQPCARGAGNRHARRHLGWSPLPVLAPGFPRDALSQPRFGGQPITTSSGIRQPGTEATIVLRRPVTPIPELPPENVSFGNEHAQLARRLPPGAGRAAATAATASTTDTKEQAS